MSEVMVRQEVDIARLDNDELVELLKAYHRNMVVSTFMIGDILVLLGKRGITTKESSKIVGIPLSLCRIAVTLARKYEERKREFDMPVDIANAISKNAKANQVDNCIAYWRENPKLTAWQMKAWIRNSLSIASAGGEEVVIGYKVATDEVGRVLPEVRKVIDVTAEGMFSPPVRACRPLGMAGPFYVIIGTANDPDEWNLYVDGVWSMTGTYGDCLHTCEGHLSEVLSEAPGMAHTEPVDIYKAYKGAAMSASQIAAGMASKVGAMNLARFLGELGVELDMGMVKRAAQILMSPDEVRASIDRDMLKEVIDMAQNSLDK